MHPPNALKAGLCACLTILAAGLSTASAGDSPSGTLSTDRALVRAGSRSLLSWQIEIPKVVREVVDIDPNGTIIPKQQLNMRVRTLGVAFQSGSTLLPIDAQYAVNSSGWQRFFYDYGPNVDPTKVLVTKTVNTGERITFGARGWAGSWLPFHCTGVTDKYVRVLASGDTPPDFAPAYNQGDIVSFLRPYLDASGKVLIGPRDLIILWECSTASPGSQYFDMQDLVLLVTFE